MFVRDFSDLDILIDPTDEALFISVMGKMGFREGKYDMYSEAFSPSTRSDVLKGKMFYHQIPPFCKKYPRTTHMRMLYFLMSIFLLFRWTD